VKVFTLLSSRFHLPSRLISVLLYLPDGPDTAEITLSIQGVAEKGTMGVATAFLVPWL
jgi:hypothetical protein